MQTTLLGLAIAVIIALVAALVGPSFIDWNQYKPQFEAEASRVVGAPVRVEGSLDARLLPAPILRLRSLSVGAPGDATKMRADKLDVEFSLSSLMRGEWRATQLSLANIALDIGLDSRGGVVAPSKGAFNFGVLAIDKLDLTGSVKVHDRASGAEYALNDISFSGDVRALGSNMRGDGNIGLSGSKQPFRLSVSQAGDNTGTRIRLDFDPAKEGGTSTGIDGVLTFDQRVPRFDGMTSLALQSERPWHVSAKTKATPSAASFEQAELVYGPDDTGLKFAGSGEFLFGKTPRLRASVSAQQLDGDRALTGEAANQNLIDLIRSGLGSLVTLPLASQIDVSVDRLVLAGRPVNNLRATLRGSAESWTIEKFSCIAPGSAVISASGTTKPSAKAFTGPLRIEAKAGKAFFDWLYRRGNDFRTNDAPLKLAAVASIGKDSIALENLKGDLSGSLVEGSLFLTDRSLKVALTSPSFDFADVEALVDPGAISLPAEAQFSLNFAEAKLSSRTVRPFVLDASYKSADQPSLSKASVNLNVRRADLTPWLGTPKIVSDLTGRFVIADNKFTLDKFDGKIGDRRIKGTLSLTRGNDASDIGGDVSVDRIEVAPLIGLVLGASGRDAAEPLAQGWFGSRGLLAVRADIVTLPGGAELTAASGTLRGDGTSLSMSDLQAGIGKGTLSASLQAKRDLSGTALNADVKIADAEGSALKYRGLAVPAARASVQVTLASTGRSATALSNALAGNGILTLSDVRLSGLNPAVFDAAVQAADGAEKSDIRKIAVATLDQAPLTVPSLQVPFAINDARLQIDPVTTEAANVRTTISGGYDLPADQVDIRASLRSTALKAPSPDIQIFAHGMPESLQREVDTSLLSSWLSLREIERETKRLDDLEKDSRPPPAATPQPPPAPASAAVTPRDVRPAEPLKERPAPKPTVRIPVAPQPNVTASDPRLAPLPPPIDIRPAPGSVRSRRPGAPLPPPGATF
ncbi:MAG: AsmA family protein [Xanthobacteraceae bacterium]|nr:AsmA family protein [Xanthobacteraceae bacterium]